MAEYLTLHEEISQSTEEALPMLQQNLIPLILDWKKENNSMSQPQLRELEIPFFSFFQWPHFPSDNSFSTSELYSPFPLRLVQKTHSAQALQLWVLWRSIMVFSTAASYDFFAVHVFIKWLSSIYFTIRSGASLWASEGSWFLFFHN